MQDQSSEFWRPVPGYEGFYSASNHGRIRSEPQAGGSVGRQMGRVLSPKPNTHRKNYLSIRLFFPGKKPSHMQLHRVVALTFIGPCPDGLQVNHKNGNKSDNRPENLEYVTCTENIRHAWANGLHGTEHAEGERNYNAKLTASNVREIRELAGTVSMRSLGVKFGITKENVWNIIRRKTWKHLE